MSGHCLYNSCVKLVHAYHCNTSNVHDRCVLVQSAGAMLYAQQHKLGAEFQFSYPSVILLVNNREQNQNFKFLLMLVSTRSVVVA